MTSLPVEKKISLLTTLKADSMSISVRVTVQEAYSIDLPFLTLGKAKSATSGGVVWLYQKVTGGN